jgi:hypothetical protein
MIILINSKEVKTTGYLDVGNVMYFKEYLGGKMFKVKFKIVAKNQIPFGCILTDSIS